MDNLITMIRKAQFQDINSLAALALQVWLTTYTSDGMRDEYAHFALTTFTPKYFSQLINNPKYKVMIYERDNAIVGFAVVNFESNYQGRDYGFEIEKLYVHNAFQGQGIGKKLLTEMKRHWGAEFWLYTWVENTSNLFYQRLGLEHIGTFSFDFSGTQIVNNVYRSK